jgi:hypothetical protein
MTRDEFAWAVADIVALALCMLAASLALLL